MPKRIRGRPPPDCGRAGPGFTTLPAAAPLFRLSSRTTPTPLNTLRKVARGGNASGAWQPPLRTIGVILLEHDGSLTIEPNVRIRPDDLARLQAMGWVA